MIFKYLKYLIRVKQAQIKQKKSMNRYLNTCNATIYRDNGISIIIPHHHITFYPITATSYSGFKASQRRKASNQDIERQKQTFKKVRPSKYIGQYVRVSKPEVNADE